MPFPLLIKVSLLKNLTTLNNNRKMHFVKFLGSQNCLPDEKMPLRKTLPDKSLALKRHNQTGIGLSIIITGLRRGA